AQAPLVAGGLRAGLVFAVLLVPTALMGATLPLAVRGVRAVRSIEADQTSGDAWAMGLLYAANTTGAIVGCLLSGLVLIGAVGLPHTILLAAGATAVAGAGAILLSFRPPLTPTPQGGTSLFTPNGGTALVTPTGGSPLFIPNGGTSPVTPTGGSPLFTPNG